MVLDAAIWPRVVEVFNAALGREASERDAFVRGACDGEPAIEAEVRSLLAAHERADGFLEDGPLDRPVRDG
jgi:serine/threonine-protein kinase